MSHYLVPIACKTLDILEVFRSSHEKLTLQEIISRTSIAHTTAFRILKTLVHRGYVYQEPASKRYSLLQVRSRPKIGFATLASDSSFAGRITESLKIAAEAAGMEVILHYNERSEKAALANARAMVAERVDVAIEFQRHEHAAPIIADIFREAAIPAIAILIPQPGAIYFGVDNYRAGITAGQALAEHAAKHWDGSFDLLLLLDLPLSGAVIQSRMTGVIRGVEQVLGAIPPERIARVNGHGTESESERIAASIFQRNPKARRILVSAVNDESAAGAMSAAGEAGLTKTTAIIGHGGSTEVWPLIERAGSPFLGTVGFYPELYGKALTDLVLSLLRGDQVAPYYYMPHELLTRSPLASAPVFQYTPQVAPKYKVSPESPRGPSRRTGGPLRPR